MSNIAEISKADKLIYILELLVREAAFTDKATTPDRYEIAQCLSSLDLSSFCSGDTKKLAVALAKNITDSGVRKESPLSTLFDGGDLEFALGIASRDLDYRQYVELSVRHRSESLSYSDYLRIGKVLSLSQELDGVRACITGLPVGHDCIEVTPKFDGL